MLLWTHTNRVSNEFGTSTGSNQSDVDTTMAFVYCKIAYCKIAYCNIASYGRRTAHHNDTKIAALYDNKQSSYIYIAIAIW